ncbi:MAG TPA: DUF2891 domain-containing protein [Streptosporangiaceae bacterium]|nr:DUF2891 domain-containing protein [Streptosporangiaceae bacterium]
MDLAAEWLDRLRPEAGGYAGLALENIAREFPALVSALMTAPGQFPSRPRDRTPVFYGSFDWHSCVEMHWVLVRLLRMAPDEVPGEEIRSALNAQLTPEGLGREAEYARLSGTGLRHYGWGWALTLMHELATWSDDNDARRWAAAMEPLAAALTANFLGWLPKATYPIRVGVHANSSFALSRALPYARLQAATSRPELAEAIEQTAHRWYGADTDYPGGWEPSGHDFLSPALAEAELMARLLPPDHFLPWLGAFLPGLAAGEPAALFTPAVVSDSSDGQIAHLHGLNLSRAWCWRRLAETLPAGDPRVPVCAAAARTHAEASLPHVVADDYMVTHWLAAYAVLLFS